MVTRILRIGRSSIAFRQYQRSLAYDLVLTGLYRIDEESANLGLKFAGQKSSSWLILPHSIVWSTGNWSMEILPSLGTDHREAKAPAPLTPTPSKVAVPSRIEMADQYFCT